MQSGHWCALRARGILLAVEGDRPPPSPEAPPAMPTPRTPAAIRAAAIRAALRHPDARGVSALQAWAGRPPAAPAPLPATVRISMLAAIASPHRSEGAMASEHDEARRPHRRGAAPRIAGRYTDDEPPWGGWRRLA